MKKMTFTEFQDRYRELEQKMSKNKESQGMLRTARVEEFGNELAKLRDEYEINRARLSERYHQDMQRIKDLHSKERCNIWHEMNELVETWRRENGSLPLTMGGVRMRLRIWRRKEARYE